MGGGIGLSVVFAWGVLDAELVRQGAFLVIQEPWMSDLFQWMVSEYHDEGFVIDRDE